MDTNELQKTEPRFERRKEARPGEILDAALDLFVERGYATTRLDDVAQRAGVSKGTVYLYFDSKEDLFKAVVRSGIVRAIEEAEQLVDEYEGSSADLLRALVSGWWESIGSTRHSGIPKLMISEAQNFPELARFYYAEVIQRGSQLFARAIERGIERGEFRPVNVDYTVRALISPLIMRSIIQHSFLPCAGPEDFDVPAYFAHTTDLLLNGLRPGGTARR
ncbi:MAG TPA: TetR/AcrR family transcriptional regulator [Burkholderiales bacterium]|nr:TetR/AcrR family transcriptional regulator [Burkholderiales bacterium]